jgi:hypothetical protein
MATVGRRKRDQLKTALAPDFEGKTWPRPGEVGWCKFPRATPAILRILDRVEIRGDRDLTRTLLDIWCRNYGDGFVELEDERHHASLAGLQPNSRGVRSWGERLDLLERLGFLKVLGRGAVRRAYVLVLDPNEAVLGLREEGLVSDELWSQYQTLRVRAGAAAATQSQASERPSGSGA